MQYGLGLEPFEGRRNFVRKARQARDLCRPGSLVLAYLALNEGRRTPEIFSIEFSIVELRLRLLNFQADADLLAFLRQTTESIHPRKNDMLNAAVMLAKDVAYFTIVFHAATTIARIQRREACRTGLPSKLESPTIATLRDIAKISGWL